MSHCILEDLAFFIASIPNASNEEVVELGDEEKNDTREDEEEEEAGNRAVSVRKEGGAHR